MPVAAHQVQQVQTGVPVNTVLCINNFLKLLESQFNGQ